MGRGVPQGWEDAIAEPIARRFGHTIRLAASDRDDGEDGAFVAVYVDDELSGELEVEWNDSWPLPQVLRDLRDRVEELCAQELGGGF